MCDRAAPVARVSYYNVGPPGMLYRYNEGILITPKCDRVCKQAQHAAAALEPATRTSWHWPSGWLWGLYPAWLWSCYCCFCCKPTIMMCLRWVMYMPNEHCCRPPAEPHLMFEEKGFQFTTLRAPQPPMPALSIQFTVTGKSCKSSWFQSTRDAAVTTRRSQSPACCPQRSHFVLQRQL